jgi:ketosteroid isomerase-like protein
MVESNNRRVVVQLWQQFDAGNFEVGELLHDDFVCEWPQSRERMVGRANYIAVNAHYPRRVRIEIQRAVAEGSMVVTEIAARDVADPTLIDRAVSFFELRDGKIAHLTEYWPDPYEAPGWRSQWVERA